MGLEPVELLLSSLCGCEQVTAQFVARNMKPRVNIDKIEYSVQASRDPKGAVYLPIGSNPPVEARLNRVWGTALVYTSASQQQIDVIASEVKVRCPIANMIASSGCTLDINYIKANSKNPIEDKPLSSIGALRNIPFTVAFYLHEGVEVLDFAGPLEVFTNAGFKVFTVASSSSTIKSQGTLTIVPDYNIGNAPSSDVIAVFGGNSSEHHKTQRSKLVVNWIQNKVKETQFFFSVCTGAFLLGEAGLLDGRVATTFHASIEELAKKYPNADVRPNVRFVDNGEIITTAGVSAGIDGALHLVAKLNGLPAARKVAAFMEYDRWQPGEGLILDEKAKSMYCQLQPSGPQRC